MKLFEHLIGKKINHVKFKELDEYYAPIGESGKGVDRKIVIFFFREDCRALEIYDDVQECHERRFIATDDDLKSFKGSTFLGIEVKPVITKPFGDPDKYDPDYTIQEIMFLEVKTSSGPITFCCHNEHNGYYDRMCPVVHLIQRQYLPISSPNAY